MTHQNPETLPESVLVGLNCFNRKAFYEAHEHFERAWRQTEDDSREFYRALLHLSGGFYRLTQDRPQGAKKFFTHGQKWIRTFSGTFGGIQTNVLESLFTKLIIALDQEEPSREIIQQYFIKLTPASEVNHENSADRI